MPAFLLLLCVNEGLAPLKTITNNLAPGPMTLELVEDLRFGPEDGGDNYLWLDAHWTVYVDADEMGRIYVMDPGQNRVLKFDQNGKFLKEVARAGEGPGELGYLLSFQVDGTGRSFVFDASGGQPKALSFDASHEYVFAHMPPQDGYIWTFLKFDNDLKSSVAILRLNNFEEKSSVTRVALLDASFNVSREFSKVSKENDPAWAKDHWEDGYWEDFYRRAFEAAMTPRWTSDFLSDGSLVCTDGESYSLDRWSPDGKKLLQRINKKHKPGRLTIKDRNTYIDLLWERAQSSVSELWRKTLTRKLLEKGVESAEIPLVKKPIYGIIGMADNNFLAVYDADVFSDHFKAHIFNDEGECIGDARFPGRGLYPWGSRQNIRVKFKKDYVYAVEKNADDENEVVRYRYRLVKR